ncbi:MAG: ABC transporter substrate-binding protein [Verrucomicrobiota bacterium]
MADWLAVPEQGGFFQALAKGYYEEVGLDVEIMHRTGNTMQTLVVSQGAADLSIGGSDEVLLAMGKGIRIKMLSGLFQNHPYCLMFHEGRRVDSFEDLDGRRVMASPGSTWIPYIEQKYKIKLDLIPLEQTVQRFLADSTREFIQAVFITNEPFVALQAGVKTETLLISESGWNPYKVIFSSRQFIRDEPEIVAAFLEASTRGWEDYMQNDPSPAHEMIADRNHAMSLEYMMFIRKSLKDFHIIEGNPSKGQAFGKLDPERLTREMQILKDLGLVETVYRVDQMIASDYLPRVGAQVD